MLGKPHLSFLPASLVPGLQEVLGGPPGFSHLFLQQQSGLAGEEGDMGSGSDGSLPRWVEVWDSVSKGEPHQPRDLREPRVWYLYIPVPLGQPLEKLDLRLFSKLKDEALLGSSHDTTYHFSLVLRDQEVKFKVSEKERFLHPVQHS